MILRLLLFVLAMLSVLSGCAQNQAQQKPGSNPYSSSAPQPPQILQNSVRSSTPDLADGPEGNLREPHALSLADLRAKYPSTFILHGPGTKREIALSFDDAPDDNFTPKVLDVLKSEGVKATFFVVGNRIEKHPDIVKRIVEEGHILGNHSYNHANLPKLSDAEFRDQIMKTDQLIREHTGYTPNIVRPPYGNISENQIKWLASQKKKVTNWNVDSLDWKGLDAEEVKTNVLAHVSPGAIILQHSAGGTGQDLSGTVLALPDIIRTLKNDGVKLVTIPELLDLNVK
ncbi:polysaccharide deacetylase family protein [Paenibacillus thiaminolyticus]|uniref:polysaccharide deacetylase family protein n=1 Tax=Paenibacillus thiaminolyticus TaxID=49283 RepID=UPI001F0D955B|nr:polysaccharide deacetylase family protein [Paenibacillus thiaminolyticus]WCR29631.1 polysaccharide deacetylase family protein [Paenibacillus thiaminolyticus]